MEKYTCTSCGNDCYRDDDHDHTVVFIDDNNVICEECSIEYEEVNGVLQVREREQA